MRSCVVAFSCNWRLYDNRQKITCFERHHPDNRMMLRIDDTKTKFWSCNDEIHGWHTIAHAHTQTHSSRSTEWWLIEGQHQRRSMQIISNCQRRKQNRVKISIDKVFLPVDDGQIREKIKLFSFDSIASCLRHVVDLQIIHSSTKWTMTANFKMLRIVHKVLVSKKIVFRYFSSHSISVASTCSLIYFWFWIEDKNVVSVRVSATTMCSKNIRSSGMDQRQICDERKDFFDQPKIPTNSFELLLHVNRQQPPHFTFFFAFDSPRFFSFLYSLSLSLTHSALLLLLVCRGIFCARFFRLSQQMRARINAPRDVSDCVHWYDESL